MTLPAPQGSDHQAAPAAVQERARSAGHRPPEQVTGHQGPPAGERPVHATPAAEHDSERTVSAQALDDRRLAARFTTATGYVATALLALTLLVGPANLVLRRRNPVSSYFRRDVGAWTAIFSVIHVVAGLGVHGPPGPPTERMLRYFFAPDGSPLTNDFGLGNWTGLAATLIVLLLLAISSDLALRQLKAGRWKWIQRLNYALFALVIAHAIYYGALLRTTSMTTLFLLVAVAAVVGAQVAGVLVWRRMRLRTMATTA